MSNKQGKWTEKEIIHKDEAIYMIEEWQSMRCDQCNHYLTTPYMYHFYHFNFCPFCGAKMKEEGDKDV